MPQKAKGATDDGGGASSEGDAFGDHGAKGDDDGEDDDDKKSDSSSPAPLFTGRKRAAAPQAPKTYAKKPRLSGGAQGIVDLVGAAKDMNSILGDMRDIFAAPAAPTALATTSVTQASTSEHAAPSVPAFQLSPQRRQAAIYQAQQETWMDPRDRLRLIQIVRNIEAADTYMSLLTEDMRIPWIIDELEKIGITVFHHKYSLGDLSGFF
ncbi:hypothetical protein B0H19DRAFT_1085458 [Mycena capillaripes]|nr:hypothetical protein B0H19DRAFT_1085458 [Mycena capillaripes]